MMYDLCGCFFLLRIILISDNPGYSVAQRYEITYL